MDGSHVIPARRRSGSCCYTFTTTPIYEARTRLLIEADNPNIISFKEVIDEQGAKADYYQTQYNILQSRILARKTLERLSLWDNQYLGQPAIGPGFFARLFKGNRGDQPVTATPAAGESIEQSRAIDRFLANLTVSPIRNSRLVDIKFRLPDAELASRVVNTLAKNYIEQNLEYRFGASKEASDWLGERLKENRNQVEQAEAALQRYREQNDAHATREPREHHRAEALGSQCRGHAGEDRAIPEAGGVQPAPVTSPGRRRAG